VGESSEAKRERLREVLGLEREEARDLEAESDSEEGRAKVAARNSDDEFF
jgi:hypothetical protein